MGPPPEDYRPLLGRKLSLRYRLHGDPEHPYSEVVGVLMSVGEPSDPTLSIVTKRAERIDVRSADVVAAKIFPA